MFLAVVLLTSILFSAVSCGSKTTDYSKDAAYAALFSEEDDDLTVELKNVLIAQNEAYNKGDAQGYYRLFNMEKDDLNFNIASFNSLRQTYKLSYTLENIHTAFINEDNAQALITMTSYAENSTTGEILYHYRSQVTYTLVNDDGWMVKEQSGEEMLDDLMEY